MKRMVFLVGVFLIGGMSEGGWAATTPPPVPHLVCAKAISLPIPLQTLVTVSPRLQLNHSRGMTHPPGYPANLKMGKTSPRRVQSIGFLSRAGKKPLIVTSGEDLNLRTFDSTSGKMTQAAYSTQSLGGGTWSAIIQAVASDGSFFITTGGPSEPSIYYDVHDLKKVMHIPTGGISGIIKPLIFRIVLITPNSKYILAITGDGVVSVVEKDAEGFVFPRRVGLKVPFQEGEVNPKTEPSLDGKLVNAALSPDGTTLTVGLLNGRLAQYAVADLLTADDGFIDPIAVNDTDYFKVSPGRGYHPSWSNTALTYTRDGRHILAALAKIEQGSRLEEQLLWGISQSEIAILDSTTLEVSAKIETVMGGAIDDILPAGKGHFVTITSSPGSSVRIWKHEAEGGVLLAEIVVARDPNLHYLSASSGPFDPIHSAALSPSGQLLAVGTDGGNLSLWDVEAAEFIVNTRLGTRVGNDLRGLSFSPDGTQLGTGSHMGDSRVFDVATLLAAGSGKKKSSLAVFVGAPAK